MIRRGYPKLNKQTVIILFIIIVAASLVYLAQDVLDRPSDDRAPAGEVGMTLHMIDVGQGDAIYIDTSDRDILIDTGSESAEKQLIGYLDDIGVREIDYLFFSHPHEDHIGNAEMVMGRYKVNNVVMPNTYQETACYRDMMTAIDYSGADLIYGGAGDSYEIGDIVIDVYSPTHGFRNESPNLVSLIMKLNYGDVDCMFTGDAEAENEEYVLYHYPGQLSCDMLKVSHHGSSTSSIPRFLDAVSPDIALISVGTDNRYGHPHRETITALHYYTDEVYRTDIDGSIVLESDGKDIWVANRTVKNVG